MTAGVLIFASASNTGANFPITFSPPIKGDEKYSAPGEAILGACPKSPFNRPGYDPKTQTIRRYGTSTSTPIAAGIAALFIDYTWQIYSHTLITTRNPNAIGIPAGGLEVDLLDPVEAIDLLLLRIGPTPHIIYPQNVKILPNKSSKSSDTYH
jgi:hypothetical protein